MAQYLTPRRLQLCQLVACGQSNKEIAYELGVTTASVKQYLYELFRVVRVHSRGELAHWWVERVGPAVGGNCRECLLRLYSR